jgi:hypothetical protein
MKIDGNIHRRNFKELRLILKTNSQIDNLKNLSNHINQL